MFTTMMMARPTALLIRTPRTGSRFQSLANHKIMPHARSAAPPNRRFRVSEEVMDSRLYLTIASIVAILYALGFLLIPTTLALFFSGVLEPHDFAILRCIASADDIEHAGRAQAILRGLGAGE
jgi:hypothetical protein